MSIYFRTEKGHIAAYGEQSPLPRKLKSLLRVIDGKTALDVYVNNLRAFGDVEKILLSLEMAGLLQHSSDAVLSDFSSVTDLPAPSNWRKLLSFRPAGEKSIPVDDPYDTATRTETFSGFYETVMQGGQQVIPFDQDAVVKQAVEEMADFVLNYAPEHAFMILKELEEISSSGQLAIAMGGYAQMIKHCGDKGTKHLEKLRQLLHSTP